jgi:membrane protein implicated in regulation of membrane protease activity
VNRSHELLSVQQNNATQGLIRGRRSSLWTWQITAAVCCLASGILAPLVGLPMLAAAWLTRSQVGGLSMYEIGNVLLLSTIPLLILGAHWLDLSDRRKVRDRRHHGDGTSAVAKGIVLKCGGRAVVRHRKSLRST